MSRTVKIVLLLNLLALAGLTFAFPHLLVSPGKLIDGHRASETDCLACHDFLFGASSEKCTVCHKVPDIGIRTTKGEPIVAGKTKVAFHQKLLGQDCVACHSDHAGVAKFRVSQRFSHALLDTTTRGQCVTCHAKPADTLHKPLSETCTQCHAVERWKPATFKHDMLAVAERARCGACHQAKTPADALHRQVSDACGQCHGTDKWKPATFDHRKSFLLDRDHDVKCTVCHTTERFKDYTCYGCHEHSVDKVQRKHLKEGIRDFENCVACHRSADEHEAKRAWQSIRRGLPYDFGAPRAPNDTRGRRDRDHD